MVVNGHTYSNSCRLNKIMLYTQLCYYCQLQKLLYYTIIIVISAIICCAVYGIGNCRVTTRKDQLRNKLHIFLDHLVLQESTIDMLTMVSTSVPQVTLLLMKLIMKYSFS